jgi:hypothetical protein
MIELLTYQIAMKIQVRRTAILRIKRKARVKMTVSWVEKKERTIRKSMMKTKCSFTKRWGLRM